MERRRHYVGPPSWPPRQGAYDYALALCRSDLAWEYLRRDPLYQRDYQLSRAGLPHPITMRSGVHLTRTRKSTPQAESWRLSCFRRPEAGGARCADCLV